MPSIIIQDITPRNQYISANAQTIFVYPFPIFAATDLSVYRRLPNVAADDTTQVLQYVTDYTVQGIGAPDGGTVTLNVQTVPNEIITIVRNMPDQRLNYYIDTAITANALNTDMESQVLMIQQNTMYASTLAPHYYQSATIDADDPGDVILPVLEANEIWIKDPTNSFITSTEIPPFPVGTFEDGIGTVNHVTRWAAPQIVKDSSVTLTDDGQFTGVTAISGLTDLGLSANSGGHVVIQGLSWPLADGAPGNVLTTDGDGNLSFVPDGTGTSPTISQPSNGFIVGDWLRLSGTTYVKAQADSYANAEAIGVVSQVIDVDNFVLTTSGFVDTFTSISGGTVYFLSPTTAGQMTSAEPVTEGQIQKPIFVGSNSTSGYVINYRGKDVPAVANLAIDGNSLISTNTDGEINLVPNGTGEVFVSSALNIQNDMPLRWYESTDTNYVAFKANDSITGDTTWTLPVADGVAGYAIVTDGAGQLSFAPGAGSTLAVTQTAHDFAVGMPVSLDGATYIRAKADNSADAECVGVVSTIIDTDHFVLTTNGLVTGIGGLTPGVVYFVSPSVAGALTATEPVTEGQIQKPILVANATNSGIVINYRGKIVPPLPGTTFLAFEDNNIVALNTNGDINLVPDGTGEVYVQDGHSLGWYEATDTNFVGFKAPSTLSVDQIYSLPLLDGTAGDVLTTNGSGVMSWEAVSGGGAVTSVSGTTSRISASPTTGDVIVDIDAAYVGQTSITTVGTLTTGVWNGTTIAVADGGTGLTSAGANGVLVSSNSSVPSWLANGTAGEVLTANTGAAPSWQPATGGGGVSSVNGTTNRIAVSPTTGACIVDIDAAYVGQSSITTVGTIITGTWTSTTIGVAHGGTGATTLTSHGVLLGNGTSAMTATTALTDGQLLIGSTGNAPSLGTLTAGTGITITPGSGAITIAASGVSGTTWNNTTGTSATLANNNGYVANNASLVTFTLPGTAAVGDTYIVQGSGAGGWLVAQASGQTIHLGSNPTTAGVSGSLASTNQWDSVTITCTTANTTFACRGVQGNITIV